MRTLFRGATHVERWLAVVEKSFLVGALSVMLVINVGQVLGRRFGLDGLGQWTDLLLALLPWLGMIGASVGVYHNRHIGFMSLRERSPRSVSAAMRTVSVVSMVGFFTVLVVSGFEAVHDQYVIGGVSPQMEIPRWVVTAAVPCGGVLMAFHALVGVVRDNDRLLGRDRTVIEEHDSGRGSVLISQP